MAAQQALSAETVVGMRRVITNHQDSSDSEGPYLQSSNRGNKLKRKQHHLHDGQSAGRSGAKSYKRTVEHGGYHRNILTRNPQRYDEDGEELADSDSDAEADARAAEENPYAEIHLENLLLPLVSAASLPNHPSLSVVYSSPILTNMAQGACEMAQREGKTLANVKRLVTRLRGDQTFLPGDLMYSERDEAIFDTMKIYNKIVSCRPSPKGNGFTTQALLNGHTKVESPSDTRKSSTSGTELGSSSSDIVKETRKESMAESDLGDIKVATNGELVGQEATGNGSKKNSGDGIIQGIDVEMAEDSRSETIPKDSEIADKNVDEIKDNTVSDRSGTGEPQQGDVMQQGPGAFSDEGEKFSMVNSPRLLRGESTAMGSCTVLANEDASINFNATPNADEAGNVESEEANEAPDPSNTAPRRMRTRAQAQAISSHAASSRNDSPESSILPEIHPLFKIPEAAIPDKDFSLPPVEAAEIRQLLTMYVQKQEEVCRGARKLHDGLIRADRQRTMVLKWCKAEAHVGEMSDGEDWYDKEEWGLDADLEKGHNEDEGDTNTTVQGKKTRGRRA